MRSVVEKKVEPVVFLFDGETFLLCIVFQD